jgi:carbonic anhydrase
VELNVAEQVQNLAETSFVQRAWLNEQRPEVHGWVYDMQTGYLKEIAHMSPGTHLEQIYEFEFNDRSGNGHS